MLSHFQKAGRRGRLLGAACAAMLAALTFASAEEPTAPSEAERAARLVQANRILDAMRLYATPDRNAERATRASEPVLRYIDSTRLTVDSSLWIWSAAGRPAAIVAIEHYPKNPEGKHCLCEIASLSSERIAVEYGTQIDWTADRPGLELARLEGAPTPAERPAARLTQIRQLQRRFTSHEKANIEGRIELRPLAKPLYRYEDPQAGLIDGAIVAFSNGTNPEVLLVLEARKTDSGSAEWQFALIQMTGEPVFAELDGTEIWTRGEAVPPARREAYLNAWITPPGE